MFKGIHLTGIYLDDNERRANEVCDALEMNLTNDHLEEMHLRVEDEPRAFFEALKGSPQQSAKRMAKIVANPKVVLSVHGKRSNYSDFFEYADEKLKDRIVILANADIGFEGDSLGLLADADLENVFLCVSRRDYIWRPNICQDVWIWKSPAKPFKRDWSFGFPGSENRLAYEAAQGGYRVLNPCLSLVVRHIHTSNVRHYTKEDTIRGHQKMVHPTDMRPLAKGRPKGNKVLATTKDPSLAAISEITTPLFKSYAQRIGADYVELANEPKRHMLGLFQKYERVLYLEPDVVILEGAPDVFGVVPEGTIGLLNEVFHTGLWTKDTEIKAMAQYGFNEFLCGRHPIHDSGVMVCDASTAYLFEGLEPIFRRRSAMPPKGGPVGPIHRDQYYLSAALAQFDAPIYRLPREWNYSKYFSKARRVKPYFINLKGVTLDKKIAGAREEASR